MALVLAVIVPVVVVHRRRLSGSIKLRIAFAEVSTAFLNFTFLFVLFVWHGGTICHVFTALPHRSLAVRHTLLSGHACPMLIGACDPMP